MDGHRRQQLILKMVQSSLGSSRDSDFRFSTRPEFGFFVEESLGKKLSTSLKINDCDQPFTPKMRCTFRSVVRILVCQPPAFMFVSLSEREAHTSNTQVAWETPNAKSLPNKPLEYEIQWAEFGEADDDDDDEDRPRPVRRSPSRSKVGHRSKRSKKNRDSSSDDDEDSEDSRSGDDSSDSSAYSGRHERKENDKGTKKDEVKTSEDSPFYQTPGGFALFLLFLLSFAC